MLITCHATDNKNMVAQEVAPIAQDYWTALLLHPLAGPWDTCKEGASQLMWQCGFEVLLSDILVVFFSMCSIAVSCNHSLALFKSILHQPLSSRCLDIGWSKFPEVVVHCTFHQCGLGLNLIINAICGLSLLLVLAFALRGFLRVLWFSLLLKNQRFQIPVPTWNGTRSLLVFFFNYSTITVL